MSEIVAAIERIRETIGQAQINSPFAANTVKLVAVTKTVEVARINEAIGAGIEVVGENRVQEVLEKHGLIEGEVEWHLIGHLQTNKVKYIIDKVSLIHSLDRISLAAEINKRAQQAGLRMPVLVQVNVAKEDTKFGLMPEDVISFIKDMEQYPNLHVRGLMTIAPYVENAEEVRPVFKQLRELRDKVNSLNLPYVDMKFLSMGMTNDFEVAIEEGANIVRIGSAIFGKRAPK